MFNLGMGELLIILVIALIFLGPSKLPEVASSLGKAIRSFRKATSDLKDSLEVDDSIKAPIRELKAALRDEPMPNVVTPRPPAQPAVPLAANNPPAIPTAAAATPPAPAPVPSPAQPPVAPGAKPSADKIAKS